MSKRLLLRTNFLLARIALSLSLQLVELLHFFLILADAARQALHAVHETAMQLLELARVLSL